MTMLLPPGEPAVGAWRVANVEAVIDRVLDVSRPPANRPRIVAVDGRGASGKSTFAHLIHRRVPHSTIVHTDDIAWNEAYFGWGHLLRDGVLLPLHRGERVQLRPPAWIEHGREGAIEVQDTALVIIEGVGASQRDMRELIDASVWMQSDFAAAEARGIARDVIAGTNGDSSATAEFWHEWMDEELRFLRDQRPWERADVIVAGTPPFDLRAGELAFALGPLVERMCSDETHGRAGSAHPS